LSQHGYLHIFVVSGLVPRWAAAAPKPGELDFSETARRLYWGGFATQRGTSPLTTGRFFSL
ncbi:hypothetical protein, partial [Pseudomonas sp. SWRI 103]|uniref:hypothetical protein n=1 Tax=Pseudomonas sp. SWRI 103 TaxID=2725411 RepID=UPI001C499FC2